MADFFNEDFWRGTVGGIVGTLIVTGLMSTAVILAYQRFTRGLRTNWEIIQFGLIITVSLFVGIVGLRLTTPPTPLTVTEKRSDESTLVSTLSQIQNEISSLKEREAQRDRLVWPTLTNSQAETLRSRLAPVLPKGAFFVVCKDANCDPFSTQIAEIPERAGFTEKAPVGAGIAGIGDGLVLTGNSKDETVQQLHVILQDTLGKSTPVQLMDDSTLNAQFMLVVGVRR